MRLHLAKDILTIQEQDVICVSGEPFYSGVSNMLHSSFQIKAVIYFELSELFFPHRNIKVDEVIYTEFRMNIVSLKKTALREIN